MTWAPLAEASSEAVFGGKAAALAQAIQAGLPVPQGLALAASFVEAVGAGEPAPTATLAQLLDPQRALPKRGATGADTGSASDVGLGDFGVRMGRLAGLGVAPGTLRSAKGEADDGERALAGQRPVVVRVFAAVAGFLFRAQRGAETRCRDAADRCRF